MGGIMRLKNRKTGEIGNLLPYGCEDGKIRVWIGNISRPEYRYSSLAELNEEWEEDEEPKKYYYINDIGAVQREDVGMCGIDELARKEIGNYFESEEEAELAVRKLEAWKRLKDKGFRFEGIKEDYTRILQSQAPFRTGKRYLQFNKSEDEEWMKENWKDLDLLFGGKE